MEVSNTATLQTTASAVDFTFCTLFDINYLSRGVAMIQSLQKYLDSSEFFVVAFDSNTEVALRLLGLPRTRVIALRDFENNELLEAKKGRSPVEYCWTCTPAVIKYVMETFNREVVTYVDADVYFFSDPKIIFSELEGGDCLITPHWHSGEYDNSQIVGRYCVQFMPFRNTNNGRLVLNRWYQDCLKWCFYDSSTGLLGDQKYLDKWGEMFDGVCETRNRGVGVAPWNINQYSFKQADIGLEVLCNSPSLRTQLVFYHFHGLRITFDNQVVLTGPKYFLDSENFKFIYKPYLDHLKHIECDLKMLDFNLDPHGRKLSPRRSIKGRIKSGIFGFLRSRVSKNVNFPRRFR